ncbi:G5 domain-containing protein [Lysinibacillus sp. NPDC097214]|uniref:G5 domain-containing protein n=1 Tax=Lysinibacillus sp. NPDC097214 TaxID=3390584 RepID=UPI003CFC2D8E
MNRIIKIVGIVVLLFTLIWVSLSLVLENSIVFAKGDSSLSTIGDIDIGDLEENELETFLQDAVHEWSETPITVSAGEVSITFPSNSLSFDISSAVAQYKSLTGKPWYAFWQKEKAVHIPIPVTANETVMQQIDAVGVWDTEKTVLQITTQAGLLKDHKMKAAVNEDFRQAEERIAFQVAEIPEAVQGISEITPLLNEVLIVPDQPMSLLAVLGKQSEMVNEDSLNFIASVLYSVVLQTDYEILERHSLQIVPSYLQQGMVADVNPFLEKDLQFINKSKKTGRLKTTLEGNKLKIEIFAPTKDKEIEVHVSKDKIVKPRIIYRYTDELKAGQERVEQEGQEGVRIEVYRSIVENGATKEQLVSKDYYAPQNWIVTRSSKEPVSVTAPIQNEGTSDPDLQMDLNGDGLPDTEESDAVNSTQKDGPEIVSGYYDKGGNFVQTSP